MNQSIKELLENVKDECEAEIAKERLLDLNGDSNSEETYEELLSDKPLFGKSLATIAESEWDDLRVSRESVFGHPEWNFEKERSPLYIGRAKINFHQVLAEGVMLTNYENKPLFCFARAISWYTLPQNSCMGQVGSYNTSVMWSHRVFQLCRFLHKHNIFIDTHGDGSYLTARHLTEDDFDRHIKSAIKSPFMKYSLALCIRLWQDLSAAGYLPGCYSIDREIVNKEMLTALRKEREESQDTYMPISLDALSVVVPYCVDFITKYAEDILSAYEILHPIYLNKKDKKGKTYPWESAVSALSKIQTDLWDMKAFKNESGSLNHKMAKYVRKEINKHPDLRKHSYGDIWTKKVSEVLQIAQELNIDLTVELGISCYDLNKINNHFRSVFTILRNACAVLIFLVTGMRNSEFMHLEAGKAKPFPGVSGEYRLQFMVFKTSDCSQGDIVMLPIPGIVFKAYEVLERLTEKARQHSNTDKLFINPTVHFGEFKTQGSINTFLVSFWAFLGINEHIHSHMFRKTLAMFAIYKDPRNINILKRIFSHKSLPMTFAYIVQMPGMAEEVKLAVLEMNMDLLAEVMQAAVNGKIGGKCGLRIQDQMKTSNFFARLNDDGRETLRQYVDSILEGGLMILHRCSMNVVCTNTHESIVEVSPEVCNCEVVNCDNAVFTEKSIPDLKESIQFHTQFVKHPYVSADQVKYSKRIINECLGRLEEVQGKDIVMAEYPAHNRFVS